MDKDDFEFGLDGLESSLGSVSEMTRVFEVRLRDMQSALGESVRDLGNLERGFSSGLKRAFDGLVLDGARLSDVLNGLARSMVKTAYDAAVRPVTDHMGGLLASGVNALVSDMMPFAQGGAISQGRVMAFAKGGVVSQPTSFPMRGGATGLMGEAGPEAIMPLERAADGRLAVRGGGGASIQVTMNITTPDVQGFQRSRGQVAAQLGRAIMSAQRNR